LGALLTLVFAFPIDVVAPRQLDLCVYLFDCFFYGAAEVTTAHAVLDGDVPLVPLTVDFRASVAFFDLTKLREGDSYAGWRLQADVLDGFLRGSILGEIAHH